MNEREQRFVGELVEASLRTFARGGPRAGLENRVLAGVRARQRAASRRKVWAWSMAVAGVMVMATLVAVHLHYQKPSALPLTAKVPVTVSTPVTANLAPTAPVAAPREAGRHVPRRHVDARPQQFPTPRPLSEQEKLLVEYARALQKASVASTPQPNQDLDHDLVIPPVNISAIKIEPLPSLNGGEAK